MKISAFPLLCSTVCLLFALSASADIANPGDDGDDDDDAPECECGVVGSGTGSGLVELMVFLVE